MPIAEPAEVDLEAIEQPLLLGDAAEHAFGHGRAADIAETDEQEPVSCHGRLSHEDARDKAGEWPNAGPGLASCEGATPILFLGTFGFFFLARMRTMMALDDASDLSNAALGRQISLPHLPSGRRCAHDFWAKLKRFAGMVPFVEDLVAAYYCALDPATPMRVRGMLLAAIAYFILPFDFIPDMIAGLGFADDAALLTAVIGLVAAHITPTHRAAAARALDKELPKTRSV